MRQVLGPRALGRPRGIGWRGRWEGGSGWGIHVNPWLFHVNVRQKPLQYCKVISLQLIKINKKLKNKKNKTESHYKFWMHYWGHKRIPVRTLPAPDEPKIAEVIPALATHTVKQKTETALQQFRRNERLNVLCPKLA